nr:uncharacterized protein LOC109730377 [Microcebus murinus]
MTGCPGSVTGPLRRPPTAAPQSPQQGASGRRQHPWEVVQDRRGHLSGQHRPGSRRHLVTRPPHTSVHGHCARVGAESHVVEELGSQPGSWLPLTCLTEVAPHPVLFRGTQGVICPDGAVDKWLLASVSLVTRPLALTYIRVNTVLVSGLKTAECVTKLKRGTECHKVLHAQRDGAVQQLTAWWHLEMTSNTLMPVTMLLTEVLRARARWGCCWISGCD